jgi:hypothetical protein
MALCVSGSNCWVAVSVAKDDGLQVSHVYCQSKARGVKCRLKGLPGKKTYVLCSECFEPVSCTRYKGRRLPSDPR